MPVFASDALRVCMHFKIWLNVGIPIWFLIRTQYHFPVSSTFRTNLHIKMYRWTCMSHHPCDLRATRVSQCLHQERSPWTSLCLTVCSFIHFSNKFKDHKLLLGINITHSHCCSFCCISPHHQASDTLISNSAFGFYRQQEARSIVQESVG